MDIQTLESRIGYPLSDEQKKILTHQDGTLSVVACAGSGKTTTIETKMVYDIVNERVAPDEILCVTFSKPAQLDMRDKFQNIYTTITDSFPNHTPKFTTFHALFLNLLRGITRKKYHITNISAYMQQLMKVLDFQLESELDVKEGILEMENYRSFLINTLVSTDGTDGEYKHTFGVKFNKEEYMKVIRKYNLYKEVDNHIDFEDIQAHLLHYMRTDEEARQMVQQHIHESYKHIYVDEFQDISPIQFELLKLLIADRWEHVTVIGDDDQSIYQFRGSDPEFILKFNERVPNVTTLYLSTNYRCPNNILKHARRSIEGNINRLDKSIRAFKSGGDIQYIQEHKKYTETLEMIRSDFYEAPTQTYAVICRNNLQLSIFADKMMSEGIPVYLKNQHQSLQSQEFYKEFLDVIDMVKNNDYDLFRTHGHKLYLLMAKAHIGRIAKEVEGAGLKWIDAMNNDFRFTPTDKRLVTAIVQEIEKETDMRKLVHYVKQLLSPFYEKLAEKGLTKVYRFNEVMEHFEIQFEKTPMTYEHFLKKEMSKQQAVIENSEHKQGIQLATFHGVKGLEFDNVYIIHAEGRMTPNRSILRMMVTEGQVLDAFKFIEEERRLFYVASTRAKSKLRIIYQLGDKSMFVDEMEKGIPRNVLYALNDKEMVLKFTTELIRLLDSGGLMKEDMNDILSDEKVVDIEEIKRYITPDIEDHIASLR